MLIFGHLPINIDSVNRAIFLVVWIGPYSWSWFKETDNSLLSLLFSLAFFFSWSILRDTQSYNPKLTWSSTKSWSNTFWLHLLSVHQMQCTFLQTLKCSPSHSSSITRIQVVSEVTEDSVTSILAHIHHHTFCILAGTTMQTDAIWTRFLMQAAPGGRKNRWFVGGKSPSWNFWQDFGWEASEFWTGPNLQNWKIIIGILLKENYWNSRTKDWRKVVRTIPSLALS